jgi:hypothetical protein
MRKTFPASFALVLSLSAFLCACAGWGTPPVRTGQSESEVIARLGQPTHRYQDGQQHLLEYMHGPMGQTTYMARIDADGKLVSYEQVLTAEKFNTIKPGQTRKEDVLRIIGAPSETAAFPFSQLEAWSYPYKEQGAWDSMMSVYFDTAGVVRKLENGPDPRRMPNGRGGRH